MTQRAWSRAAGGDVHTAAFRFAFVLFAAGTVGGLLFASLGPVPFIRGLGYAAAIAGALGMLCALAGGAGASLAGAHHAARRHRAPWRAEDTGVDERLPVWPGVTQPAQPADAPA